MDLIRDDATVALNEVVLAARTAAARHRECAGHVDDGTLADRLRGLATALDEAAGTLAGHVQAAGDFAPAPPDESLLADAALMRLRLAVAADEAATVRELSAEWRGAVREALRTYGGDVPHAAVADVARIGELLDTAEQP